MKETTWNLHTKDYPLSGILWVSLRLTGMDLIDWDDLVKHGVPTGHPQHGPFESIKRMFRPSVCASIWEGHKSLYMVFDVSRRDTKWYNKMVSIIGVPLAS